MTTTTPATPLTPTTVDRVSFDSSGVTLTGNLYRPQADQVGALPAVVVTGTWTSIKEQMADRYAQELAARGYAALSFDFTGYGESEGHPRNYESPQLKARDIHAAITYLTQHPDLDADRVAALGVCASAGYTAVNATTDPRVRALALVAPWLHNAQLVREIYGGDQGVAERMTAGQAAQARYQDTGQVDYVPAVSANDPLAAMPFSIDFYENPNRGALPQWPNKFAVMAWPGWLAFDPIATAPLLSIPTLVVHSEDAAIPQGAHQFINALQAPHQELWTDGTQFDFYDQRAQVELAVTSAAQHFRHLG